MSGSKALESLPVGLAYLQRYAVLVRWMDCSSPQLILKDTMEDAVLCADGMRHRAQVEDATPVRVLGHLRPVLSDGVSRGGAEVLPDGMD